MLDRHSVLPYLQSLKDFSIDRQQDADTASTFAELEAKCGSSFEREVLRANRDRGLPLPNEAQKTLYDGDAPIASADFFYKPRILVFVDGSPHYKDYVQADDDTKRRKLKAMGYRVVPITDLEQGLDELEQRLR